MNGARYTAWTLMGMTAVFSVLAICFLLNLWGRAPQLKPIPLVDPEFTRMDTVRQSYGELLRADADLIEFDCYLCHEEGEPPPLHFDENHRLIIPDEHSDIVMTHGRHDRNNNCFNCHNELNLLKLQTRDGRELGFEESSSLCGSCHGPTYRDWEAGAHGRTGGYWEADSGALSRQDCVSCHNPHSPDFPPREPAPGPNPLRVASKTGAPAPASNH